MSFTVPPGPAPERVGVHHRAARRTALALAFALAPSAVFACPQCAADPSAPAAVPAALVALALAPVGALLAGALWVARDAHRRAEVE
jgi:hypothetical protein